MKIDRETSHGSFEDEGGRGRRRVVDGLDAYVAREEAEGC